MRGHCATHSKLSLSPHLYSVHAQLLPITLPQNKPIKVQKKVISDWLSHLLPQSTGSTRRWQRRVFMAIYIYQFEFSSQEIWQNQTVKNNNRNNDRQYKCHWSHWVQNSQRSPVLIRCWLRGTLNSGKSPAPAVQRFSERKFCVQLTAHAQSKSL